MKLNMIGLPFLDKTILGAIFQVAPDPQVLLPEIPDQALRDFIEMLLAMARYNVKYRQQQLNKLVPVLAEVGDEPLGDPEQASTVLGLSLAIKDLYGMRPDTFKAVLRQWSAGG